MTNKSTLAELGQMFRKHYRRKRIKKTVLMIVTGIITGAVIAWLFHLKI